MIYTTEGSLMRILIFIGIFVLGSVFTSSVHADTDPEITLFGTLGAKLEDTPCHVGLDGSGNIYIVAESNSSNYPTTPGAFLNFNPSRNLNIVVTKLDSTGSVVYSTFVGSTTSNSRCGGAFVDTAGRVYITGWTTRADYPTTPNAYQRTIRGDTDVFVSILNPTGSALEYSTFLGSSDHDEGHGIAVDATGRLWVTGQTSGRDLPARNAVQSTLRGSSDGFAFLLNPSLPPADQLIYATYLGGDAADSLDSLALDSEGNPTLAGWSSSINYPAVNAFQSSLNGSTDGVISRINAALSGSSSLTYSTYFGGSGRESLLNKVRMMPSGTLLISGHTESPSLPVAATPPYDGTCGSSGTCDGHSDAFWILFNPNASGSSQLIYSTYFGGIEIDRAYSIAFTNDKIAVVGSTRSGDLPFAGNVRGPSAEGENAFVSLWEIDGTPSLLNSVVLQGNSDDRARDVVFESNGDLLVVGSTVSRQFTNLDVIVRDDIRLLPDIFLTRLHYSPATLTGAGSGGTSGNAGSSGAGGDGGVSGTSPVPTIIFGQEYRVGGNAVNCSLILTD